MSTCLYTYKNKTYTSQVELFEELNKDGLVDNYLKHNIERESRWFKSTFPSIDFNITKRLVDGKAWGKFSNSAVYVYDNAQAGTTYHEAFHVVYRMSLNNEGRASVENDFINSEYYNKDSSDSVEEQLADSFADYMLGVDSFSGKITEFFKNLLDIIVTFIKGSNANTNTRKLFRNIKSGRFATPNAINDVFGKDAYSLIGNNEGEMLSPLDSAEIGEFVHYGFMVGLISKENEDGSYNVDYREILKLQSIDPELKQKAYDMAYNRIADYYDELGEDEISNEIAKNLDIALDNFTPDESNNSAVKMHEVYLKSLGFTPSKSLMNSNKALDDETTGKDEDETIKGDSKENAWANESLETNSLSKASGRVKFALSTIPSMDENGNINTNPKYGFSKFSNFKYNFVKLQDLLSNSQTLAQMESKILELAKTDYEVAFLAKNYLFFGNDVDKSKINIDVLNFRADFFQSMSKNKNKFQSLSYDQNEKTFELVELRDEAAKSNIASDMSNKIRESKVFNSDYKAKKPKNMKDGEFKSKHGFFDVAMLKEFLNDKTPDRVKKYFNIEYSDELKKDLDLLSKINNSFFNIARKIVENPSGSGINVDPFSVRTDFQGYINTILNAELDVLPGYIENSVTTSDGNTKFNNTDNNELSFQVNAINSYSNRKDLEQDFPFFNDEYTANSLVLNNMDNTKIQYNIITDSFSYGIDRKAIDYKNLSQSEKALFHLQIFSETKNTSQVGFLLRASDNSVERAFSYNGLLNIFDKNKHQEAVKNYILDEITDIAKVVQNVDGVQNVKNYHKFTAENLPKTGLDGFYLSIIKDKYNINENVIDELIRNPNQLSPRLLAESIYATHEEVITEAYNEGIENLVNDSVKGLMKVGAVTKSANQYILGNKSLSEQALYSEIEDYVKFNLMNLTEQSKLFLGNPIGYKNTADMIKRVTGATGTKMTVNYGRKNSEIESIYNDNFYMQDKDGNPTEAMRYNENGSQPVFHAITFSDPEVISSNPELRKKYNEFKNKKYEGMEEPDGYSIMHGSLARNILVRSKAWEVGNEAWYQYMMGNTNIPDNPIWGDDAGKPIEDFELKPINTLKLQYFHSSADKTNKKTFLKLEASILFPKTQVEENGESVKRNINGLYEFMNKEGNPKFAVFSSGEKLGEIGKYEIATDNKGVFTSNKLYNEAGETTPFVYDPNTNKTTVVETKTDDTFATYDLYLSNFGIQMDTGEGVKSKVSDGTQREWHVLSGMSNNGSTKAMSFPLLGLNESSEDNAKQVLDRYNNLIKEKISMLSKKMRKELGFNENEELVDRDKFVDKLISLAEANGNDQNTLDSINLLREDGKRIEEVLNASKVMTSVLSLIDKETINKKVLGSPAIQMPQTLMEQIGARKTETLDGKTYITSDTLKSYGKNPDGTTFMEVYVPNYYAEYGVDHAWLLENQPKLLELIGFRIPTQLLQSIDAIKIKGFLPKEAGDTIVLPTEIVAKSGADYDIDKLNLHRPYFDVVNGKPEYIEYIEDDYLETEKDRKVLSQKITMQGTSYEAEAITPNGDKILITFNGEKSRFDVFTKYNKETDTYSSSGKLLSFEKTKEIASMYLDKDVIKNLYKWSEEGNKNNEEGFKNRIEIEKKLEQLFTKKPKKEGFNKSLEKQYSNYIKRNYFKDVEKYIALDLFSKRNSSNKDITERINKLKEEQELNDKAYDDLVKNLFGENPDKEMYYLKSVVDEIETKSEDVKKQYNEILSEIRQAQYNNKESRNALYKSYEDKISKEDILSKVNDSLSSSGYHSGDGYFHDFYYMNEDIMDEDEFSKLSEAERNGFEATQNMINQIQKAIILSPENYDNLTNPLDTTYLKDSYYKVQWLKAGNESKDIGTQEYEDFKRALDNKTNNKSFYELANPATMSEISHDNLESPKLTATSALAMKSAIVAQTEGGNTLSSLVNLFPVKTFNDGKIGHNNNALKDDSVNTLMILNEFLNGAVDSVKDPYLRASGINKSTFNVAAYALRSGGHPYDIMLWLNNPAIQEFIEYRNNQRGLMSSEFKSNKKILDKFKESISSKSVKGLVKRSVYNRNELENSINEYDLKLLENFIEAESAVQEISTLERDSAVQQRNLVFSIGGSKRLAEKALDASNQLGYTKNAYYAKEVLKNMNSLADISLVSQTYDKTSSLLRKLSESNEEEFLKKADQYNIGLVDYAILNSSKVTFNGVDYTVKDYNLVKGSKSEISDMINKLKAEPLFKDNPLIQDIIVKTDPTSSFTTMTLNTFGLTEADITKYRGGFMQLSSYNSEYAVKMMIGLLSQSSRFRNKSNFVQLLSPDMYNQFVNSSDKSYYNDKNENYDIAFLSYYHNNSDMIKKSRGIKKDEELINEFNDNMVTIGSRKYSSIVIDGKTYDLNKDEDLKYLNRKTAIGLSLYAPILYKYELDASGIQTSIIQVESTKNDKHFNFRTNWIKFNPTVLEKEDLKSGIILDTDNAENC